MKISGILVVGVTLLSISTGAGAAVIDNTGSDTGDVFAFGAENTATYGQTLLGLAGPDLRLDSFSMFLRTRWEGSGTLDLRGYVAEWDGTRASSILFESATQTMNADGTAQEFAFSTGGLNLVAGGDYVLFLSIANLAAQGTSQFGMPITGDTLSGQFVFLNNGTDFGALVTDDWTLGWLGDDDVALKASFSAIPLPATLPLLLAGLGIAGLGAGFRRKVA
jgi:hypothetical protein